MSLLLRLFYNFSLCFLGIVDVSNHCFFYMDEEEEEEEIVFLVEQRLRGCCCRLMLS